MMNAQKYLETLFAKLNDDMELTKTTRFQHDNAPCHKVRSVIQCFIRMGLRFWTGRQTVKTSISLRNLGAPQR
jgi:hypothetical protein